MALNIVEDSLESIAEPFHELYTEKDGKFHLTGVVGLKTQDDINRLNIALAKEREETKKVKEKYAPISSLGKSVDEIITLVDRIPELELAAKGNIDETKIEEILQPRIKAKLGPIERALETEKQKAKDLESQLTTYQQRERANVLKTALSKAAKETKVRDDAIDDAVMLAERYFEIDETGAVIGKSDMQGVSPGIDPVAWFIENQTKRTYLWGETIGGGAGGSRESFGGVSNPWSADNWNMTKQGEIFKANPQRANQLAKMAGTTIGGPKPKK